jgi:cytidine deaminase
MIKKDLSFHIFEAESLEELSQEEQKLVLLAKEMTKKPMRPIPNFLWVPPFLLENGEVITGSNQENGAYPSGLCAERVAVFAASAMFPGIQI